ncbi:DUF5691 domain-containing protein [Streptomyces sp. Ac-502]|uniref:DUF5691 domain-containing protein n=1 Tax=Streptomyces sp. Ac-502 TaxID=3342801 RepID=UPI0038622A14
MIETRSTHGARLGPTAGPGPSWEELVSSALLGTERRTPPVAAREGRSTAAALLDAAAVSTVRRRAALRPAPARERPVPAPADPRPPLPPAARHRLALLLADRNGTGGGHRRGTAPDLTELLPQWLATAAQYDYRAPEALLPALLDAARARTDLRAAALAFAGPRALWLARLNDEWKFALRGVGSTAALPGTDEPEAVHTLWEEGLFAERVSLLAALRRRDPAAGLALLATTWPSEPAEDRLMFLDSLREGLSMADEPFLERALSDRSRNVRGTAAELLSALPGTALAARMADRARACVSLVRTEGDADPTVTGPSVTGPSGTDPTGTNPSGTDPTCTNPTSAAGHAARPPRTETVGTDGAWALVVQAPRACDAAMQRDGVVPRPPSGRGERAWWLSQLLEAAPLECWSGWLGGLEPAEIVALPVADGWRTELHDAWCRAAVRQRDAAWTRALLGPRPPPQPPPPPQQPPPPPQQPPLPLPLPLRRPATPPPTARPARRVTWRGC